MVDGFRAKFRALKSQTLGGGGGVRDVWGCEFEGFQTKKTISVRCKVTVHW